MRFFRFSDFHKVIREGERERAAIVKVNYPPPFDR